jgi:TIR domain
MAIFISYSHQNRDFVDELAIRLIHEHVHIWLDRWELRAGDSITTRIESALESASAVLLCLSKASVSSDWCRRELNAGLVRELEERRVIVLPLLIEDCDVPLFLRDKYRADFRIDFEEGFGQVLDAIAPATSLHRGRIESPEWLTDWAQDYSQGERVYQRLTIVNHSTTTPVTTITEVDIVGNQMASKIHQEYVDAGLEWFGDRLIVEMLSDVLSEKLTMLLDDHMPRTMNLVVQGKSYGADYEVRITSRLLGRDTGASIVVLLGRQLRQIIDEQRKASRPVTPEERAKIMALRANRQRR